ncbi:hypothetical protein Z517_07265 [Fonsecaea pedrosoi CBS 271.37]|uniref:Unplaced genomic scaffold supercont1.4, whole genome shotgun sequence n=1 Tax=Fonsecaea pedrosoi CBS 271.37 TaxID=1442368 RepID=A0A0D2H7M2_9EURO|nr:uncharacterized protein Z517_07265 [Fonsecaea pedrosoi CBS 271.37]KIW80649.1 hypothetical protein Z517_07265 [Fonsecaea pedrosoi CBS 271.37]
MKHDKSRPHESLICVGYIAIQGIDVSYAAGDPRNQRLGYLTAVRTPASTPTASSNIKLQTNVLLAVKVSCDNVSGTRIVDRSLAEQAAPPAAAHENIEPEYPDVIGWMLDPSWIDTASPNNTTEPLQIPITTL